MIPFVLTDYESALLEPLIPKSAHADNRKIMNVIFYVPRTGTHGPIYRSAMGLKRRPQSLQWLVSTRHLEADLRYVGSQIARQSVSDRQHHRESSPREQRR
jgi:hypothetical protein